MVVVANKTRSIRLDCFPWPPGSIDPHVFHAILRNYEWPSREALLSACPKGLFRLENVEYEGLLGKAFITLEQAEWLRQALKFNDLKSLAKTPLLYTVNNVPSWKPRVALGKTAAPVIDKQAPLDVQKKQWQDWALRFYKGEVEKRPPALRVSLGRDGDLYIFSMRISLHYYRAGKLRSERARKIRPGGCVSPMKTINRWSIVMERF